jgi:hypothetical protein
MVFCCRDNKLWNFSPQFGDFFNDMVLHVILSSVDAQNAAYWTTPDTDPANGTELIAYCDYIGQRLCQRVQFTVNGNPLDQYDQEVYNFHNDFFITPNKRAGWNKNVGQEIGHQGYSDVLQANGRAGRGAGVRLGQEVFDGPQTPQPSQGQVELWIPLLFWFNKDPRLSIPSVSIPYGQRFITVTLAAANLLLQQLHAYDPSLDAPGTNTVPAPDVNTCELYINNIFVNPEIHDIFIKRIGFSLIRVHKQQTIRTNKASEQILLNNLKWPIETIYCGMRPTANVDTTSTAMLTDWHRYGSMTHSTVSGASSADYPQMLAPFAALTYTGVDAQIAGISAAGRVLESVTAITGLSGAAAPTVAGLNQWLGFYGFPLMDPADFVDPAAPTLIELNTHWPAVGVNATSTNGVWGGVSSVAVKYETCAPVLDRISILAHGVPLYNQIPATFFNSYIPYNYGGSHIQTPDDCGVYMIPFNLYPGSYQPSGHVNVSRAREFYFDFTSSTLGSSVASADLVVCAIAINFLLISDGELCAINSQLAGREARVSDKSEKCMN